MKLELVVLFALVAFVACGKGGNNLVCHVKGCSDVTCEQNHCVCLHKALNTLLKSNSCGCKYPKEWVSKYSKIVDDRCDCIVHCENKCDKSMILKCFKDAHSRSICAYIDLIKKIGNDKRLKLLLKDLARINADCINNDCGQQCTGNTDCDPLLDPSSNAGCVKLALGTIIDLLKNAAVKNILHELRNVVVSALLKVAECKKKSNPKNRQKCIDEVIKKARIEVDALNQKIIDKVGPCTALGIINLYNVALIQC